MVRLHCHAGDDRIRSFGQRICHKKLKLPGFVAARSESEEIVTLDVNLRPA
jgi:hypothetical protein